MKTGTQRLLKICLVAMVLPIAFMACNKKPSFPNCKKDNDCSVDARGEFLNGVCVMGKCEECAQDTDCVGLKQCVNNRCEAVCQVDADCSSDKYCSENYCMSDCVSDSACPGDRVCAKGRCVAQADSDVNADIYAMKNSDCEGLGQIHFDFDRYDIKPEYREQVEQLARCLESNPSFSVMIEGHTDHRGTPSYNMALGERRAAAVKRFLRLEKGIASYRIKTISYGEQKPVINERNEYAWRKNRRAEIDVRKQR